MHTDQYTLNFEHKTMKPNLLNFANNVLLSPEKRGTYNITTGQQSPDVGFFVELFEEKRPGVDQDTIREFYLENAELLANENLWLGVWWDGEDWKYGIAELVYDLDTAVFKGITRGTGAIFNNASGEYIELPLPQEKGTETQKRDYARIEADKIVARYTNG